VTLARLTGRVRRMRRTAALGCLLALGGPAVLGACTSSGPAPVPAPSAAPPPAPCRTDVLAGWQAAGLAVLWSGPTLSDYSEQEGWAGLPAAIAAMDVHTGQIRAYCPLPTPSSDPAKAARQQDYGLGMQQGGADYQHYLADPDLMLRTQAFSPDFRWFTAPGLPLVDVAAGRIVPTGWTGTAVGLGPGLALVRTGDGATATWCTQALPPVAGAACTPLTRPAGPGSFVVGPAGSPVWVPAATQPYAFGTVTGYAITDGVRLYGAETLTAAARGAETEKIGSDDAPVDLDPTGRGGFTTLVPGQPRGLHLVNDWFTVEAIGGGTIRTTYHHTTAPNDDIRWMWGGVKDRSRAIADGGTVAVTAGQVRDGTRFGALVDGSGKAYDLTKDRGLRCPGPNSFCRILAWPDGSLTPGETPAP
jgi:hypothetical protein